MYTDLKGLNMLFFIAGILLFQGLLFVKSTTGGFEIKFFIFVIEGVIMKRLKCTLFLGAKQAPL